MNDFEKTQAQQLAMNAPLNSYAMQQQEAGVRRLMWDDIQVLKQDVEKLKAAIDYIQDFLRKAYPTE